MTNRMNDSKDKSPLAGGMDAMRITIFHSPSRGIFNPQKATFDSWEELGIKSPRDLVGDKCLCGPGKSGRMMYKIGDTIHEIYCLFNKPKAEALLAALIKLSEGVTDLEVLTATNPICYDAKKKIIVSTGPEPLVVTEQLKTAIAAADRTSAEFMAEIKRRDKEEGGGSDGND